MTSITWSNDVDTIKTTIFGFPKSMAITPVALQIETFQFSLTHRAVFGDFEFVHGVEKSRACAREARKIHFCTPRRVFAHAHYKLEFDDAKR